MAASRMSSSTRLCCRYKFFIYLSVLMLGLQLFLAYNFYNMDQKEIEQLERLRSDLEVSHRFSAGPPLADHPKISQLHFRTVLENEKGPPAGPENLSNVNSINKMSFSAKCEIIKKETASALQRAKTVECKQKIADVACLEKGGGLYSQSLQSYCPYKGNDTGKYLGCYKDSHTKRELTGHHKDFPSNNSPTVCVAHCLLAGFQYAGLQYTRECWCGDSFGKYGKLKENECSNRCPRNSNETCGGFLAMRMFSTGLGEKPKNKAPLLKTNDTTVTNPVRIVFVFTLNGRALRQVFRLFRALYQVSQYYYFHVDARQEYLHRELLPLEKSFLNVHVAKSRLATIWGGASLLQAHLHIMTELLSMTNWSWDYYVNLSESDYPIKKPEDLIAYLTRYRSYNFLKSHGRDTPRFIQKQGLDQTFYECENHLWRLGPRTLPTGIRIDGGSDWIGLHRDYCEYIITTKDELVEGLKQFYRFTLLPAESFFHTVLQNSKFCDTVVDNNLRITNWRRKQGCKCQYKHIVDWCGCSPNDFKTDDLHKIMSLEEKPTFFGRKFEPVVNQEIINNLDNYLFGHNSQVFPGYSSYWQNEYHYLDVHTKVDDAYRTFYDSFVRRSVRELSASQSQCRLRLLKLLEVNVFYEDDHFHGLLVKHKVESVATRDIYELEMHVHPKKYYSITNPSEAVARLQSLEVGSNFDPKELLFRNFAQLLGPHSDIALRHSWGYGVEVTVSVAWIDPSNTVAASFDIKIPPVLHVSAHKPQFKKPLRPGVWTVKLFHEWKVFAEVKFLIVPLTYLKGRAITTQEIYQINNGPAEYYLDRDFSDFIKLLKVDNVTEAQNNANINGRKVGSQLLLWIDTLTAQFWHVQNTCTTKGRQLPGCHQVAHCNLTSWSSGSSDPKSQITKIDRKTGNLR